MTSNRDNSPGHGSFLSSSIHTSGWTMRLGQTFCSTGAESAAPDRLQRKAALSEEIRWGLEASLPTMPSWNMALPVGSENKTQSKLWLPARESGPSKVKVKSEEHGKSPRTCPRHPPCWLFGGPKNDDIYLWWECCEKVSQRLSRKMLSKVFLGSSSLPWNSFLSPNNGQLGRISMGNHYTRAMALIELHHTSFCFLIFKEKNIQEPVYYNAAII